MATYGLKFELFFQDLEDRRFKLEIHKKNYTGSVSALVGGGNPVEIEWSGDDDIYSPIRGSRCKINLMVTSTTSYDAFHESDEREYLVKVMKHDSYGYFWESEQTEWELANANWEEDTGGDFFWEPIWQGFLVVDRFKEQMIHKPFPIKLEAIDGLGTLGGFDSPFDTTNVTDAKNLFYYITEILKLTGHEHHIYVANEIRKDGGATNDTIFHDIEVNPYAFFTPNLILRNAKEVLEQILMITNSRIYHSYGHWYIVSNSNLIEKDVDQLAICPSGADIVIDPDPIGDPADTIQIPVVKIYTNSSDVSSFTYSDGQTLYFRGENTGSPHTSYTFDVDGFTVKTGGTETPFLNSTNANFAPLGLDSSNNGDEVRVTMTNSAGSANDSVTLVRTTDPPPPPPTCQLDGNITFTPNLLGTLNARIEPTQDVIPITGSDNDNNVTITGEFTLIPDVDFQLPAISDISITSRTTGLSLTSSQITDNGNGTYSVKPFVTATCGSSNYQFTLSAATKRKEYTTTITFTNNASNTSLSATTLTFTNPAQPNSDADFEGTVLLNTNSGFYFNNISDISLTVANGVNNLAVSKREITENQIEIKVSGVVPFGNTTNKTDTVTITGTPFNDGDATGITSGVTISSALTLPFYATTAYTFQFVSNPNNTALFNGRFKIIATVHTGGNARVDFVTISPSQGNEATRFITITVKTNPTNSQRFALIKFVTLDESTTLHTLTLTQRGITVGSP